MTTSPVSLDGLISFVTALHPGESALAHLADAVAVAGRVEEQADALIGHFVDRARRSGASWSQIGEQMGVSKQAVQKRFVPRWDGSDPITEGQLFSRFTVRARHVLAAASVMAGDAPIGAAHIVVATLTQPDGVAARLLLADGRTQDVIAAAFGLTPQAGPEADAAILRQLSFADDGQLLLEGTLAATLQLGHNYVGTEHLLLGGLLAEGTVARTLNELGVTSESVRQDIEEFMARLRADPSA